MLPTPSEMVRVCEIETQGCSFYQALSPYKRREGREGREGGREEGREGGKGERKKGGGREGREGGREGRREEGGGKEGREGRDKLAIPATTVKEESYADTLIVRIVR